MKTCKKDGCKEKHYGRGFCRSHYNIFWKENNFRKLTTEELKTKIEENVVVVGECWEWKLSRHDKGYGIICVNSNGSCKRVHRVSYESYIGPIPKGMMVCHTCDNPPCCNPAHLWLGTNQDNVSDMISKGRKTTEQREKIHDRH
jgi:hypothetical protein